MFAHPPGPDPEERDLRHLLESLEARISRLEEHLDPAPSTERAAGLHFVRENPIVGNIYLAYMLLLLVIGLILYQAIVRESQIFGTPIPVSSSGRIHQVLPSF